MARRAQPPSAVLYVRVPLHIKETLDRLADETDLSIRAVVVRLLTDALEGYASGDGRRDAGRQP